MNWSGGYKSRFRPRSEVLARKSTFQQQSRIVLVDNVGIKEREETNQTPPSVEESQDKTAPVQRDVQVVAIYETPFSNIPCGSSSDSEDSASVLISDTNYSPYSSDQETEIPFTEANENHVPSTNLTNEFNRSIVPYQNSGSSSLNASPSNVGYATSPPYYLNQRFQFTTPSLSFLTPVVHREKTAEPTLNHRNSNLHFTSYATLQEKNVPATPFASSQDSQKYATPISDKMIVHATSTHHERCDPPYHATPVQKETTGQISPLRNSYCFNTPMQDPKIPVPSNYSIYTPVVTLDATPRRKQVRFAADPSQHTVYCCDSPIPFHPIKETVLSENPKPVEPPLIEQPSDHVQHRTTLTSPVKVNDKVIIKTTTTTSREHQEENPGQASEEILHIPETNENLNKKTRTSKFGPTANKNLKRKQLIARNTKSSSKKKFHSPCHCRTVVRTIKIRDAETQTD